jgi:MFS superfamily sulfate permease-like transporter
VPFDDPLTLTVIVVGVIVACSIIIFAVWRREKKRKKSTKQDQLEPELRGYPFKVVKSVPKEEAAEAKDELRTLDLEREILSDAIRHLYEAHAEGKITEQERERLAQSYKSRMMTVKNAISKDESLVALHELETMQQDLMKLFSDRFDELTTKIEELRTKTEAKPIKEITISSKTLEAETEESTEEGEKTGSEDKRKRKPPQPKTTQRTEAERRIEEIRAEVEKVLDKLGQMEIES